MLIQIIRKTDIKGKRNAFLLQAYERGQRIYHGYCRGRPDQSGFLGITIPTEDREGLSLAKGLKESISRLIKKDEETEDKKIDVTHISLKKLNKTTELRFRLLIDENTNALIVIKENRTTGLQAQISYFSEELPLLDHISVQEQRPLTSRIGITVLPGSVLDQSWYLKKI